MSRQYDEQMEGTFEYRGETYRLVEPSNFAELRQALQITDVIQSAIDGLLHDEDSSGWCWLLEEQNGYIQEYIDSIGDFDNSCLVGNIAFLTKKNGLRIGEIESLLGLSAGYISRTAKENSAKRLSIDVVWKIARLFEVDIKDLLETNMQEPDSNTDLAIRFIKKVYAETNSGLLEWRNIGGALTGLDQNLEESGFANVVGNETYVKSLFFNKPFLLVEDIFTCDNLVKGGEMLIVPYSNGSRPEDTTHYEFIMVCDEDDGSHLKYGNRYLCRMFTTMDDPFEELVEPSENLYSLLKARDNDTRIPAAAKELITNYLKAK